MRATCPTHLNCCSTYKANNNILVGTTIILYNIPYPQVFSLTPSLLSTNINLYSLLRVRDQVSDSYKTTEKIDLFFFHFLHFKAEDTQKAGVATGRLCHLPQ